MRLIRETKNVGSDVYERTVGCSLNLHELVEELETNDTKFGMGGYTYYVGNPVEYEVFVSGKPVEASKISISIYDTEDDKPNYWACESTGEELDTEDLTEAQSLSKMSKEELIAKVISLRNGNSE